MEEHANTDRTMAKLLTNFEVVFAATTPRDAYEIQVDTGIKKEDKEDG